MGIQKFSRQREAIKRNISSRRDHPTAEMVYSDIKHIYPNISLGTVYRNLALLSDQGEIRMLITNDGLQRFDYNTDPHCHFVCRTCGCVEDMPVEDNCFISSPSIKNFSGSIEECDVTFYGQCEKCCIKS